MTNRPFGTSTYRAVLIMTLLLGSCKSGPFTVFRQASPHEMYERNLVNSGLGQTAMGKTWIDLSERILQTPVAIDIPYQEKGYFPAEEIHAAAFSFTMQRGQKLQVRLNKKPLHGFRIFTDIWEREEDGRFKVLGSSDTAGTAFQTDVDRTGTYILRLQPELLAGGEYTLEITYGPSLAYPLKNYRHDQIRSFFGDGRDADTRKHEGIDIFSTFRTPVLAAAPGTARVNENNLGGKVVWLRPEGKNFTLYYAHLDEQTVSDGQTVRTGDTLGRMGNTGNARTTPPHLHFGVYAPGGAVDPLPYVNPKVRETPAIRSDLALLNATVRTIGDAEFISPGAGRMPGMKNGTIAQVRAASATTYRVELPDGSTGYLPSLKVTATARGVRKLKLNPDQTLMFDQPDSSAAVKLYLTPGETVDVIGSFRNYHLINAGKKSGWVKR